MIDAMKLVIPEPQRFFCEADEKHQRTANQIHGNRNPSSISE